METIDKILKIFRENKIRAGETLEKRKLMEGISSLSSSEKSQVRDVWHYLVGNGIIHESNPSGPTLTQLGEEILYTES